MKAIVAVDENWAIGYKGELLQRIPDDMKFFKKMTLGKVVVMGRETFESLPGQKPLNDRTNIVLSRNKNLEIEGGVVCHSIEELGKALNSYNSEDIFVIGGEAVYAMLLPYCNEAYVTKIESSYTADKYLVNLDADPNWELTAKSEPETYNGISYSFLKYRNIACLKSFC